MGSAGCPTDGAIGRGLGTTNANMMGAESRFVKRVPPHLPKPIMAQSDLKAAGMTTTFTKEGWGAGNRFEIGARRHHLKRDALCRA